MKTHLKGKSLYLLIVAMASALAGQAQADLEFSSGGGPVGQGVSIANQIVTFRQNTDNPTGNTFVPFTTPTTTVTFSFTNQQYALPTTQMSTGKPMVFGAAINNSGPKAVNYTLYGQMSAISAPWDNLFTSLPTLTPGTGISVTNNYATEFMISAMPLYNLGLPTTGRYYMGDLNITFSTPLTDPVIHIVGAGAYYSSLGFSSEYELQTPGITLSELSGSSELTLVSNKLLNNAAHPSFVTGSGAFSGSIWAQGTNITSLSFKVYLRGDGGQSTWAGSSSHSGDQVLIAVSTRIPVVVLPITLGNFTATAQSGRTHLQWSTLTESNTNFFDIQYSRDQENWQSIGTVTAAGNSNTERNYSFIHTEPAPGTNYYRLRIVYLDNPSSWSPVRELNFAAPAQVIAYPNPTRGACTLTGTGTSLTAVTIMAMDGRPLQQISHFVSGNTIQLSQYPTGIYLIAATDNTGKTQLLKIFKD